jgi:16S rRNA (cytidine1402-2'-O)-methyltransferase
VGHPTLHLIAAPLDHGLEAPAPIVDLLGAEALRVAAGLRHWAVENARTARAVLARVNAVVPLGVPMQSLSIAELPRPRKGAAEGNAAPAWAALLAPMRQGHDLGLMSEAGLPAVADPGARLVAAAHDAGFAICVHPGSSALLLALAASGLNGQSFAFVGYLPVDAAERADRLARLDAHARRTGQAQIAIEAPYRNRALFEAMLQHLAPATRLSVSIALCTPQARTWSRPVSGWRAMPESLPDDQPAVFCFGPG